VSRAVAEESGIPADESTPIAKRILLGGPLTSEQLDEQALPKRRALPIFASDALSSVAYAPQELVMILAIGGTAFLAFAPPVAAAVVALLIVVVLSYRQLIKAYPSGGGDYEVVRTNLGERAGVVVASALLVDYILTVAVSIASGVDNIISALPVLDPWRVELAVGFVILIVIVNLRGVREASTAFAVPTYLFIGSVAVMIVVGILRWVAGDPPTASSAAYTVQAEHLSQAATILLILRAFSSGCSALTGVEAVSNGVPAFRMPKVRNAQSTLVTMGAIAILLFSGLTLLALVTGVHYAENPCHLVGFDCTTPQPSDRGGQFRAKRTQNLLKNNGLVGSMGRSYGAGDNASMESFFSLLQNNVLNTRRWDTRADLRLAMVTWIETKYNRRRRQRGLGRLTPIEFEMIYQDAEAA